MSGNHTTIPAEARGIVRRWKAALVPTSNQIYASRKIPGVDDTLVAIAHKKGVGRDRSIAKLRRMLPALRLQTLGRDYSVWAFLAPCEPLIVNAEDEGQRQKAVSINFMYGGREEAQFSLEIGQWTMEVPDHALHRLAQRSPNCDIGKTLWDGHRNLLAAQCIRPIPGPDQNFLLPAGNGVFAGQFIFGANQDDEKLFYFRARTWLHQDQLEDERAMLAVGSPSMGQIELAPVPMRERLGLTLRYLGP